MLITDPVSAINADIDSLMARLPGLPAWAAHQICGWAWLDVKSEYRSTTEETEREERRQESEYSHLERAHSKVTQ